MLTVTRHRAIVRLRWRTRLRVWLARRRLSPAARALEATIAREAARWAMFGDDV